MAKIKYLNRKYLLQSGPRIAKISRLIAKGVDFFLVLLLSLFFYPVGILLGLGYLVICDHLQNGQSIGKKLIGFNVVSLEDGTPCSLKQSCVRNLPFIIPLFFAIFPLWGWLFGFILGLPLIALEIYLLLKLDSGHRLGDVMADTTVIANDPEGMKISKKHESWFNSDEAGQPL